MVADQPSECSNSLRVSRGQGWHPCETRWLLPRDELARMMRFPLHQAEVGAKKRLGDTVGSARAS